MPKNTKYVNIFQNPLMVCLKLKFLQIWRSFQHLEHVLQKKLYFSVFEKNCNFENIFIVKIFWKKFALFKL